MPRPRTHDLETVLDAARTIVLDQGARAATVAAIAKASGAPTGSLYHAFGSRDQILAAAWGRAAARSQTNWLEAAKHPDPIQAGVDMALSLLTFAREHTADTYLLLGMRLEDLTDGPADLGAVNDPVVKTLGELAARLDGPATHERAVLATVDLPYGAIRRRLLGGKPPPPALDGPVAAAVRAVLQGAPA